MISRSKFFRAAAQSIIKRGLVSTSPLSAVRPPEVSCKIHVDEFVADNFLALRKRAKINCFVTTIINYREENVGRNEQKR